MENLPAVQAEKSLQTRQSNALFSALPEPPDDGRARAIYRIAAEVELSKSFRMPPTDQQREVLMRFLSGTGWTIEEIARVGQKVAQSNTYGSIAFDAWMTAHDAIWPPQTRKWNPLRDETPEEEAARNAEYEKLDAANRAYDEEKERERLERRRDYLASKGDGESYLG